MFTAIRRLWLEHRRTAVLENLAVYSAAKQAAVRAGDGEMADRLQADIDWLQEKRRMLTVLLLKIRDDSPTTPER